MSKLSERIKELRLIQCWTLEHLATLAGVSKGHLWEIENGRTEPKAYTLKRIADALGVCVDNLFDGTPTDKETTAISRFLNLTSYSKKTACDVINALWVRDRRGV